MSNTVGPNPPPPIAPFPEPAPPPQGNTALNAAQFRQFFNAFGDTTKYPDAYIDAWLQYADKMLLMPPWTEPPRSLAMALYAAHWIVLDQRDGNTSSGGGVPGSPAQVQTSKSVGGVSVGYDTSLSTFQGAGTWNSTSYGARFYQMAMLVGMAGTQLGGPDIYLDDRFGRAWPGVIYPW